MFCGCVWGDLFWFGFVVVFFIVVVCGFVFPHLRLSIFSFLSFLELWPSLSTDSPAKVSVQLSLEHFSLKLWVAGFADGEDLY